MEGMKFETMLKIDCISVQVISRIDNFSLNQTLILKHLYCFQIICNLYYSIEKH